MLTIIHGDLVIRSGDDELTSAEAWLREYRREQLVRLLDEIAEPPRDEPEAATRPISTRA